MWLVCKKSLLLLTLLITIIGICSVGCACGGDVRVQFDANGGSVDTAMETIPSGTTITLPTPTRKGFVCVGWYNAVEGGKIVGQPGESYNATGSIKLYARWMAGVTVTFSGVGGSVDPREMVVIPGSSIILPMPIRYGHTFLGWGTSWINLDKIVGMDGDNLTIDEDTSLFAQWIHNVTIVFQPGPSANVSPTSQTLPADTVISLPLPTRNGYIFDGWYTLPSGGALVGRAGDPFVLDGVLTTLYAYWIASGVTVSYNATGGTVAPSSETIIAGGSVILPAPIRSGYQFNGWYSALSGGVRVGGAGDSFVVMTDTLLYAQWTLI